MTFASMVLRNLDNLDYSAVSGDPEKEQFYVRSDRFVFIDKRLVSLYCEPQSLILIYQVVDFAPFLETPRHDPWPLADAEKKIGASGTLDVASGILIHHETECSLPAGYFIVPVKNGLSNENERQSARRINGFVRG